VLLQADQKADGASTPLHSLPISALNTGPVPAPQPQLQPEQNLQQLLQALSSSSQLNLQQLLLAVSSQAQPMYMLAEQVRGACALSRRSTASTASTASRASRRCRAPCPALPPSVQARPLTRAAPAARPPAGAAAAGGQRAALLGQRRRAGFAHGHRRAVHRQQVSSR
jgi:hypothetical protein